MTRVVFLAVLLLAGLSHISKGAAISARRSGNAQVAVANQTTANPVYDRRLQVAGNVRMAISNYGSFPGNYFGVAGYRGELYDNYPPLTDCSAEFEFPAGTCTRHLFDGGLWVGGIVGGDTLVSLSVDALSLGRDELSGFDSIRESSNLEDSPFYDPHARSQQQFDCRYYDTLVLANGDEVTGRPHKPLGLEITQTSHAWLSAPYDNFIIVEYSIRNISLAVIESAYVGFFFDSDVWTQGGTGGASDDLGGYLRGEGIAYTIDNDGDPSGDSVWNATSCRGGFGVVPLRIDPAPCCTTYNWWTLTNGGWGPANSNSPQELRQPPRGDRNRYLTMSDGEIDYDQLWAAVDMQHDGWRDPYEGPGVAAGGDNRFLLSFGGFNLSPGDSVTLAIALVAGDSIHQNPSDFALYFDPQQPQRYYDRLYFGDLIRNAQTARRIYSNGFEPVGGAPVHIGAEPLTDTTALLRWSPAPYRGVGGYRLYRHLQSDAGSWELIDTTGPDRLVSADRFVRPRETYKYAVSAFDTAGVEGPMSRSAVLAAGVPLVVPSVDAVTEGATVRIKWSAPVQSPGFSPWKFLNIYRYPLYEETTYLRAQIPLASTGASAGPRRSRVEAASAGPHRSLVPPPVTPEIPGEFIDSEVVSGRPYFYSASLTNELGLEGAECSADSVLPMAFDKGVLVVMVVLDSANWDAFVKADSTRAFYGEWASRTLADTIVINRRYSSNKVPNLEVLSRYRSVILVWEDAFGGGAAGYFTDALEEYISQGGHCLLIGRYLPARLSSVYWFGWIESPADFLFDDRSFARRILGVHRELYEETWPNYDLCPPSVQFVMASSTVIGYPSLRGDSARALDNPYFNYLLGDTCVIQGGGLVPAVGVIDSIEDAEVLYTYQAGFPDTSRYQGKPIAIRRDYGKGRVILLNFPLSVMERPAAWDALDAAMRDLGADDLGSETKTGASVAHQLSEFLFGPTGRTPEAAWDINGDGSIDVRDLVLSIKASAPTRYQRRGIQ